LEGRGEVGFRSRGRHENDIGSFRWIDVTVGRENKFNVEPTDTSMRLLKAATTV